MEKHQTTPINTLEKRFDFQNNMKKSNMQRAKEQINNHLSNDIIPTTVIANEMINALDNSIFSSETKNNIICDYLDKSYVYGCEDGIKGLIDDMRLVTKDDATKTMLNTIIKKATTTNDNFLNANE